MVGRRGRVGQLKRGETDDPLAGTRVGLALCRAVRCGGVAVRKLRRLPCASPCTRSTSSRTSSTGAPSYTSHIASGRDVLRPLPGRARRARRRATPSGSPAPPSGTTTAGGTPSSPTLCGRGSGERRLAHSREPGQRDDPDLVVGQGAEQTDSRPRPPCRDRRACSTSTTPRSTARRPSCPAARRRGDDQPCWSGPVT